MNISLSWLKIYISITIGLLCLIILGIISVGIYSRLNIKDELCETFSLCPYKSDGVDREHHFVAYYSNPLFFGKNIIVAGSDKFVSYNTSSPADYVWGKVFGDDMTQDMSDKLAGSAFMIEAPFGDNKKMQRGVDICRYGSRLCKEERLYQSQKGKRDIVEHDVCMVILVQDEGSEVLEVLEKYNKQCYVIDIRHRSWDKIALWFENS